MLTFVGLGLYDERDVSVKGLQTIRDSDLVYAEFYTSRLMGATPEKLAQLYGREVKVLTREEVEVSPEGWLGRAKEEKVAFLVGGDPMISTTHLDLRLRALRMGIENEDSPLLHHRHRRIGDDGASELSVQQVHQISYPRWRGARG